MTDEKKDSEQQIYSENDFCPICGLLAASEKKHICPEHILNEICQAEVAKSEEINDDGEKSYGEKLDDAEFMLNYYEGVYDDDDDEF